MSGHRCVQVSTILAHQDRLVKVREDVQLEDMEVMELLLTLRKQGWSHHVVQSRKGLPKDSDYIDGASEKKWYSRAGQETVTRDYLLCLLSAEQRKQPVPHLQAAAVYAKILGRPVKEQVRRKAQSQFMFLHDEHQLVVPDAMLAPIPRQRKRARRTMSESLVPDLVLQDADADAEQEAVEGEGSIVAGNDGAGESGQAEPSVDAPMQDAPANRPDHKPSSSSSDSSSSSSSDTSAPPGRAGDDSSSGSGSDSSDSSSSDSSSSSQGEPTEAKKKKGFTRRTDTSIAHGPCRITPAKTGFQMTCRRPKHQGETACCTKTRSSNIEGADMALRLLKTWALWGRNVASKQAHQSVWKQVLDAKKNNSLPSMQQLDDAHFRSYPTR